MLASRPLRTAIPLTLLVLGACGAASDPVAGQAASGRAVARLADAATTCANGGNVLKYGVDKNGNGKLDDDEVTGSFDICNGVSGTLTKLVNVAAGDQCYAGGVLVKAGSDTNGNGTLDDSEVTSTTPICAANSQITSVVGDLYIYNDSDLAKYAHVETVSGGVSIDLNGMSGTVSLPNLHTVGLSFRVIGGGCCDLLAEQHPLRRRTRGALLLNDDNDSPTVNLSLPALTTVLQEMYVPNNVTLSAPVLATVNGELNCSDPNAVLSALIHVGYLDQNCGNFSALQLQVQDWGGNFDVQSPNTTYPNFTSLGVGTNSDGSLDWGDGTLSLQDPNLTHVSFANLTRVGSMQMFGVYDPNAILSLPQLAAAGSLSLSSADATLDFLSLTPPVAQAFHTIDAPLFTTIHGWLEHNSADDQYRTLTAGLQHIGGRWTVGYSSTTAIDANGLLTVGSIDVQNSSQLTHFATPQLTQLVPGDANYNLYNGQTFGGFYNCGAQSYDPNVMNSCTSVSFLSNASLTQINLGQLSSIPGGIYIRENEALTSITGLSQVTHLGGRIPDTADNTPVVASLEIADTGLTSLAAFASITSTAGQVVVVDNANLVSISDLQMTGSASNCPFVHNNPQLDYCAAAAFYQHYNSACVLGSTPAATQLKDPCDGVTCQSGSCVVSCTHANGYVCQ